METAVGRVVPSGSVIGTDGRRSIRGVDFAESPCRKIRNKNNHKYDNILLSRKEHRLKLLWASRVWDLCRGLTSVAWTGVDCDMSTQAGLAGLLASVYAVKTLVEALAL